MSDDGAFFGDFDPEDAWDDGDPIDDRLTILERVIESLEDDRDRFEARRLEALRLVSKLSDEIGDHRRRRRRLARIRDTLEGMG